MVDEHRPQRALKPALMLAPQRPVRAQQEVACAQGEQGSFPRQQHRRLAQARDPRPSPPAPKEAPQAPLRPAKATPKAPPQALKSTVVAVRVVQEDVEDARV